MSKTQIHLCEEGAALWRFDLLQVCFQGCSHCYVQRETQMQVFRIAIRPWRTLQDGSDRSNYGAVPMYQLQRQELFTTEHHYQEEIQEKYKTVKKQRINTVLF